MDTAPAVEPKPDGQHEPRVVGFVCNWDAYSGVEMAGVEGREYAAGLRLVRVTCLGRLHLGILLRAFELGADGVLLMGCPPRDCHHGHGSVQASGLVQEARKVLGLLGADPERIEFVEVPLGGSEVFVERVEAFMNRIKRLEPSALFASRHTAKIMEEASKC